MSKNKNTLSAIAGAFAYKQGVSHSLLIDFIDDLLHVMPSALMNGHKFEERFDKIKQDILDDHHIDIDEFTSY